VFSISDLDEGRGENADVVLVYAVIENGLIVDELF
jgi:hypothetical protein